ncbi:protein of unknown function [Methylacidimicrobium sp. AP8]|uniref:hypothetical protein n=1 Tax=Methylacidimicrobium sp. AP8 TaxID=2730359 RepID=UPI0018C0B8CC|nr:hypothetical protein [Methylacidimicrobium sp. AP8]CAB4244267.1 protein of unknown function [Methylacidimicrobium sp. AP8]
MNTVAGLRAWWGNRDAWLTRREQGLVLFLLVLLTLGGIVKLLRESLGGPDLDPAARGAASATDASFGARN